MIFALALQAAVYAATALPGDHPPLPLALMLDPPHGGPPPADPTAAPPSDAALAAARVAVTRCLAQGARLGVAVVDARGGLRAALAADGAAPDHLFIAARKAAAAAVFGQPTSQVQAGLRTGVIATTRLKPYMAVTPGAVPLRIGGRLVGAIGASGGSGTQDEDCAAAGAAAMAKTLEKAR